MVPRFLLLILVALLVNTGCCFTAQLSSSRKHTGTLRSGPVASQRSSRLSRPSLGSSTCLESTTASVTGDFKFRGHKIYSEVYAGSNKNLDVILIHGFGCSTVYWRETIRLLQQEGYTVHAIDLLGQGKSDKPGRPDGIEYSINLWARQVDEYAKANIPASRGAILMGNSLGSTVALVAATGDFDRSGDDNSNCYLRQQTKGIGMYNCGIGMNSQNVEYDFEGVQRVLVSALFGVLNTLVFGNVPLLTYILDKVVTKDLLRNALTGLYQFSTEDRVDDALVDSFYYPAKDPGSPQTLSQIYTNDPGSTPWEIYERHRELLENQMPIHIVWGRQDGVTPIAGSVGRFFQKLSEEEGNSISLDVIDGGHIPFDEVPSCNNLMVDWLKGVDSSLTKPPNSLFGGNIDFKLPFFGK